MLKFWIKLTGNSHLISNVIAMKAQIATLDIETDPFEYGNLPKPFVVDYYNGEDHYTFWSKDCVERSWQFLADTKKPTVIYAHNGGKFDWHYYTQFFADNCEMFIINGRFVEIKFNNLSLRDSWTLFPMALKQFAIKKDIDFNKLKSDVRETHKAEIISYLHQDTKGLHDQITPFIERFGNKLTLASVAMDQAKKLGIKIKRKDEINDEIIRPYYYGGRTECFDKGIFKGRYYYIDINSAYPFAMSSACHAHCINYNVSNTPPKNETLFKQSFFTVECDSFGALPWKDHKGSLHFPTERKTYNVTGWELFTGLKTNTVKNVVYKTVLMPTSFIDLSEYVNHWYEEKRLAKQEKNNMRYLHAKLLMNSLYGKFSQNPRNFKSYEFIPIGIHPIEFEAIHSKYEMDQIINAKTVKDLPDSGLTLWEISSYDGESGFIDVATAASITGFVRAYLWESILQTKNPIYCDTDSIICKDMGNLKLGEKLGEWSLDDTASEVCIAGKKLYGLKSIKKNEKDLPIFKTASKGAKLSYEAIRKISQGEKIKYFQDAPIFSLRFGHRFLERNIRMT